MVTTRRFFGPQPLLPCACRLYLHPPRLSPKAEDMAMEDMAMEDAAAQAPCPVGGPPRVCQGATRRPGPHPGRSLRPPTGRRRRHCRHALSIRHRRHRVPQRHRGRRQHRGRRGRRQHRVHPGRRRRRVPPAPVRLRRRSACRSGRRRRCNPSTCCRLRHVAAVLPRLACGACPARCVRALGRPLRHRRQILRRSWAR